MYALQRHPPQKKCKFLNLTAMLQGGRETIVRLFHNGGKETGAYVDHGRLLDPSSLLLKRGIK